jgi:hypothetical protein
MKAEAERALVDGIKASPLLCAIVRYAVFPVIRMVQRCLLRAPSSVRTRLRELFPPLWIWREHDGPPRGSELPPGLLFYELEGSRVVNAGELFGGDHDKLVVLNAGSYTWGPFRESLGRLEELMLGEFAEIATLVHVYIREAHPTDEWQMGSNGPSVEHPAGLCFRQPTTISARIEIARKMVSDCGLVARVVCDSIENDAEYVLAACPDRLYVLRGGRIVYKGGAGPFLYDVDEIATFLRDFRHHG